MSGKAKWVGLAMAAMVAVALMIGSASANTVEGHYPGRSAHPPRVVGVSAKSAVASETANGWPVKVTYDYSPRYKRNVICSQKWGSRGTVWLVSSLGKAPAMKYLGTFTATAYSYSWNDAGAGGSNTCANGMRVGLGRIAVDRRVIKLNTKLYIPGYHTGKAYGRDGNCIAADTGGAIIGHHVDLFFPTRAQMNAWGTRKVRIYVRK